MAASKRTDPLLVDEPGLPELLKAVRRRLRLTQQELGDRAGVDATTITRLEQPFTGTGRRPRIDTLERVAAALGVPVGALVAAAREWAATPDEAGRDQLVSRLVATAPPPPAPMAAMPMASAPAAATPVGAAAAESRQSGLVRGAGTRTPRIATMPAGTVEHVDLSALGEDEDGALWVDPVAYVVPGGDPRQCPLVERYGSGEIVVDVSRLEVPLSPRNPSLHVQRAAERYDGHRAAVFEPDPGLVTAYRNTLIDIHWPKRKPTTVGFAPLGETTGKFPGGHRVIHVITAYNPQSRLVEQSANAERDRVLRLDLEELGLDPIRATGRSRDGTWVEEGWALRDTDRDLVLRLARKYEQTAIYEWTPDHLAIVWTDARREDERGGWAHGAATERRRRGG